MSSNKNRRGNQMTQQSTQETNQAPVVEQQGTVDETQAEQKETQAQQEQMQTETQETAEQPPAQEQAEEPVQDVKLSSATIAPKYDAQVGTAATEEEVASVTTERVDTRTDVRSEFDRHIDKLLETGSTREKYVITFMSKYVNAMAPGKQMSVDEGVRNQTELWRTIKNVVENQDGFDAAWRLMIAYVRNYRTTVFHESYVFRFMENTVLAAPEARTFERMLNVLLTASGVQNRREVTKLVDLNNRLTAGLSEEARARLIRYFTS
jgi:chemotaxis protein histidine kinase CheA